MDKNLYRVFRIDIIECVRAARELELDTLQYIMCMALVELERHMREDVRHNKPLDIPPLPPNTPPMSVDTALEALKLELRLKF